MRYNEVLIKSDALGGCELGGILNRPPLPRGAVAFSHNSRGDMNDSLILNLEQFIYGSGYATLRYNFHYVSRFPVEGAKFEDIMLDLDAAYSLLLGAVVVKNVFFVGKSLGAVACMKYLAENNLRCPLLILGFFEPLVSKYIPDSIMKSLQAPVMVLHGERDQYTPSENVRTILGRNRVDFELFPLVNANHSLTSVDESVRTNEDIFGEVKTKATDFLSRFTS